MIRLIIASLVICLFALGSSFAAVKLFSNEAEPETVSEFLGGLDYVKTQIFSVPIIRGNRLDGYMLVQLVYTIDGKKLEKLSVRPEPVLVDLAFRILYNAADDLDVINTSGFDRDAFTSDLRTETNTWLQEKLIHQVSIEQFEFLPADEISRGAKR